MLVKNHETDYVQHRGAIYRSHTLLLDWAIVSRAAAAALDVPLIGSLQLQPVLDLSTPSGELIGNLARTLIIGMRDAGPLLRCPLAMAQLTDAFADLIVRCVPHKSSHLFEGKQHLIAPWHVRRAIDLMHAHIAEPITISAIAEAVGVSVRSLESAFRHFKQTTPITYLRTIRLTAARQDLCDQSNRLPVKEICRKWGFFHFGRFAAIYRAAYGESPTATRKRSFDA